MPCNLNTVLDKSVKVVNFIKSRALNSRLFSIICNEMGSEHKKLLLHTDVRWLSRGNVLSRLFELRAEVQMFAMDSKFAKANLFLNDLWLMRLAYLADIFGKLKELNSSLQGRNITPFLVFDRVKAMIKKLQFMMVVRCPTVERHCISITALIFERKQSSTESRFGGGYKTSLFSIDFELSFVLSRTIR